MNLTVVCWVLDTKKCFDTPKKKLQTLDFGLCFQTFLSWVKTFLCVQNAVDHGLSLYIVIIVYSNNGVYQIHSSIYNFHVDISSTSTSPLYLSFQQTACDPGT